MATVLITGGSSGMGAALAVEMARRGHKIGVIARREDRLQQTCEAIEKVQGTAIYAVADVTDAEKMTAAVQTIVDALGPIDILVANAGGGGPMPVKKWNGELAKWVMRLNYEGLINTLDPVLPHMIERGAGHIAVVSSVASYRGIAPGGPYSAAKAAQSTLFEALAVELRPRGIAVTSIHPGFVLTEIHGPDGPKHPVPFIVSSEYAATVMADGLEGRRRFINFPLRMAWMMAAVRMLPSFVFERLMYMTISPKLKP